MYTLPACSTSSSHLFLGHWAWYPTEGGRPWGPEGASMISNLPQTFAGHLFSGMYYSKHFISIISFNPYITLGKESTCQCRRRWFNLWVRKIPWRRKWQCTPVFLPGKFHRQRSLAGYSPWVCKESDTTEHAQRNRTGIPGNGYCYQGRLCGLICLTSYPYGGDMKAGPEGVQLQGVYCLRTPAVVLCNPSPWCDATNDWM